MKQDVFSMPGTEHVEIEPNMRIGKSTGVKGRLSRPLKTAEYDCTCHAGKWYVNPYRSVIGSFRSTTGVPPVSPQTCGPTIGGVVLESAVNLIDPGIEVRTSRTLNFSHENSHLCLKDR